VRILFAAAPAYGLLLPVVPLVWAARAAGHEVLLATTSEMAEIGAAAGLPVADVHPDREHWSALMATIGRPDAVPDDLPREFHLASQQRAPFAMFTAAMTEGTVGAARAFAADLVVYTSDHPVGALTAAACNLPGLEVGNRVSWSTRDSRRASGDGGGGPRFASEELAQLVRERLGIPDSPPNLVARIDPRPPSMGGLGSDEPDALDQVPWWSMRYVPYNGGAVVPGWALTAPERPRVGVTLGTVVPMLSGSSTLGVVVEALSELDVDVILASGRADLSGLGPLPGNVRSVGYLPLSTFIASCSLLIHHGGSGTTAAPLFYGVPQLVLPSFADNPLSAERVVDRGVGLSGDPATVDADRVRSLALRLLDEPQFSRAAQEVAVEMAAQPSPAVVMERVAAALD
jgi:UDP:flavonoid glycosyltransferase YjiC (YdhE family)